MIDGACGTHPGLTTELRTLAVTVLDRVAPVLDGLTADAAEPSTLPTTCASCPVCAVLALLRGERSELAVRLAEQLSGLLTVLRAAMDEGDPAADRQETAPCPEPARGGDRIIQQILVERPGSER